MAGIMLMEALFFIVPGYMNDYKACLTTEHNPWVSKAI